MVKGVITMTDSEKKLGALTDNTCKTSQETMPNLYASREFIDYDLDPRIVATKAAIRDARLPDRLFQPGGYQNSTQMQQGVEYLIR